MKNNGHINSVLFDLDGTLLDTAPDLAAALNQTLQNHGRKPANFADFRYTIHGGSRTMISEGFSILEDHPEFEIYKQEFLQTYQNISTQKTNYFPGMEKVLDELDRKQIPWGIVTNKPTWLTEPIIKHFALDKRSQCLICGDSLTRRKPHPDQLLHACKLIQIRPQESLYVGDTEQDIQAARAAGMKAIAVLYGYRQKDSTPHTWQADAMIESPLEIIEWIK